jgi:hypothetical protein
MSMTTVFVHHRVADYNAWKPEYDRVTKEWATDIRANHVWRGLDDPNLVIVATTFDSRETAERLMKDPALAEAMGRGGVIQSSMRIDYVDKVVG